MTDDAADKGTPSGPHPLGIRVLRMVHADGHEARWETVYCPHQEKSKTVEECAPCPRCGGLYFDPSERRSLVMCGWTPEDGLPSSTDAVARRLRPLDQEPADTPVSSIMSSEVVCVREDMDAAALATLLLDRGISGAPVVDANGKPIGIVSRTDLVEPRGAGEAQRSQIAPGAKTVADLMTPLVLALPEGASIAQAAALMAYEGIHRLPVMSDGDKIVGLVSSLDVLRWLAHRSGYLVPRATQLQKLPL